MSASSNYEAARINYEKYRTLYNKRLVTETEYLNAKTNYDSARANLQTANDSNSKSVIRTNVNGVLANLNIERHQQVAAGQSLFTLVNESEMILEVYEISGAAQNATRQFLVKIKMQNPDRELKSGMYGTASIDTGAEEGVVIPKESIVVRGVEQIVYIIKDGKAVAIPIKIVNQNETYAAVTGDGLAVGSELVVDGQNVVQDGEKVKKVN